MLRPAAYLSFCAAGAALLLFARGDTATRAVVSAGFGLAATAAVLVALRLNRSAARRPWCLVAAGLSVLAAGDAVRAAIAFDLTSAFAVPPNAAASLVGYPLLGLALLELARRRTSSRDWPSLIDASIVTVGAATVWGLFVFAPRWHAADHVSAAHVVSLLQPVAAVVLLALAVRFLITDGPGGGSYALLASGTALLLAGNLVDGIGAARGWFAPVTISGAVRPLVFALMGCAALEASMPRLTDSVDEPDGVVPRRRLGLLLLTAPLAPALVVVRALGSHSPAAVAAVAATMAVTGLVVARATGVIAGHAREIRLEHALREGAPRLVVARTREEIRAVATETAIELAGGVREAFVDLTLGGPPPANASDVLVVGTGETASWLRGEYRRAGVIGRPGSARTLILPIVVRERPAGVLRVTGRRPPSALLREALQTLVAQVAAALEGADLAEDILERHSEARFRSLVQNSRDLIAVVEPDLTIRFVTPSVEAMLGVAPAALVGTRLDALLHPEEAKETAALFGDRALTGGSSEHEFRLRHADTSWRTVEGAVANLLDDPAVRGLVLTAHDVTERRALEDELAHQAFHDSLTGLPNRALFTDRVTHSLERVARAGRLVGILFIDVDDFKTVNDSLGHAIGDELLVAVAGRLNGCMRAADTAARLGGDEFGLLIEETDGVTGSVSLAGRVLEALSRPVVVGRTEILVRASIGIVTGRPGQTAGELLRNADVAMYKAKRQGGNRFEVFEPEMHAAALARLELKADLERALGNDEFHLEFQPIVELGHASVVGLEALIRWTHPTRGAIAPAEFVPVAEETGLIPEIGHWVLRNACEQTRIWRREIPSISRLSVSVNLAGRQLQSHSLIGEVTQVLRETGLDPRDLLLEITESTLMEDVENVAARLTDLKGLGVRIAVDDFGTGFSSLGYLQRFPVDVLKIAKPFVDHVGDDQRGVRLVQAIISIADSLELTTVAEGIEKPAQQVRLRELGCALGQGYLFARPMPASEVPALLRGGLRVVA